MYQIIEYDDVTGGPETDLISLDDLKLALGIPAEDTSQDEELAADIDRYSDLVADYFGRRFAFGIALEAFHYDPLEQSRPAAPLNLSLYPVAAIESVIHNDTALALDDYTVDPAKGMLRLAGGGRWTGTVVVTYAGGYVLPDEAPAYLTTAIIESVRLQQMADDRGDTSVSSVVHGDTRVSYFQGAAGASASNAGLASSVVDLLRPFRAPVVG